MRLQNFNSMQNKTVDVDLKRHPSERWKNAVELVGDNIHQVVSDVVEHCEENLEGSPAYLKALYRLVLQGASRGMGRIVGLVAKTYGQEYQTEIKSIAQQVGVSYPQLLLGNLMYDICQIQENRTDQSCGPTACSSYSCNLPSGSPVLARNMDWAFPESLGRFNLYRIKSQKRI